MLPRNTENEGVSPFIGVILVVGIIAALMTLVSIVVFDIRNNDISESPDATVQLEQQEGQVYVRILRNGNVDKFIVEVEDNQLDTIRNVGVTTIDGEDLDDGDIIQLIANVDGNKQVIDSVEFTYLPDGDVSVVLPEDSSSLFDYGTLNRVPKDEDGDPLFGFEDAEKGDPVSDFNLTNADTSNVRNMNYMFFGAESFNQDIGGWDTSNARTMRGMIYVFTGNMSFNQDISEWNTSNVQNMASLFEGADSFNQNINKWDTSNVQKMNDMFRNANSFNQYIGGWENGNVTDTAAMFEGADAFNQDISGWNTSSLRFMSDMFKGADAFDQDIGSWNTSSAKIMDSMFKDASSFNGDIGAWNTENVIRMIAMFEGADSFNQDIGGWNTSNIEQMTDMFNSADAFNQNISEWDTSNVVSTGMRSMFRGASSFNQNISTWCVQNIPSKPDFFDSGAAFEGESNKQPNWGTDNGCN